MRRRTQTLTFLLSIGVAVLAFAEQDARACHIARACVDLNVGANDQMTGDYGTADSVMARGLRVVAVTPDEGAQNGFLDDEGCFAFETRHTAGLRLLVYPEARLGDNKNVHVRSYASQPDAVDDNPLNPWLVKFQYLSPDSLTEPRNPVVILGKSAQMLGWLIESFHNVDRYAHISGSHEIRLHSEVLDPLAHYGAYVSGDRMMLGPIARNRKFIVAHELGHWYQAHFSGQEISTAYSYEDEGAGDNEHAKDPSCDFANAPVGYINDLHGLRSAEYSRAALTEGYAHFFASLAFNDLGAGAEFEYYKEIDTSVHPAYSDLENDLYIVDLDGGPTSSGGRSAWTQNKCPNDWATPLADSDNLGEQISTELDWQRFFWGFIADTDIDLPLFDDLPEFGLILELFIAAPDLLGADIYSDLQQTMDEPGNPALYKYRERFAAVAVKNGVQTNE